MDSLNLHILSGVLFRKIKNWDKSTMLAFRSMSEIPILSANFNRTTLLQPFSFWDVSIFLCSLFLCSLQYLVLICSITPPHANNSSFKKILLYFFLFEIYFRLMVHLLYTLQRSQVLILTCYRHLQRMVTCLMPSHAFYQSNSILIEFVILHSVIDYL